MPHPQCVYSFLIQFTSWLQGDCHRWYHIHTGHYAAKEKGLILLQHEKFSYKLHSRANFLYHLPELGLILSWDNHLIRWQSGEMTYLIGLEYSEYTPKLVILPEGFAIWTKSDSFFSCEGETRFSLDETLCSLSGLWGPILIIRP